VYGHGWCQGAGEGHRGSDSSLINATKLRFRHRPFVDGIANSTVLWLVRAVNEITVVKV
jgi:hypothetical protein